MNNFRVIFTALRRIPRVHDLFSNDWFYTYFYFYFYFYDIL